MTKNFCISLLIISKSEDVVKEFAVALKFMLLKNSLYLILGDVKIAPYVFAVTG